MSWKRGSLGLVLVAALAAVPAAFAENIDPANDDHQYAWGENVGWINAEPSGDGGPGVEVGDFGLTGFMWGENIGWISLTCANTSSCGTSAYGVSNDGFGALSGFAWSENAGWIHFRPTTCAPDPTCGVRIDPATGHFGGRAWGENIGWITFASAAPTGSTVRTSWCSTTAAPPGTGFALRVGKSGPDASLAWSALPGAAWYDVVQGRLSVLRSSRGDFTAATEQCVASRLASTSRIVSGPDPLTGDALWFLVRGANCRGRGSFDSGSPRQAGSRDAEIDASPNRCP